MTEKEQLWYTRFLDYANSECTQRDWCKKNGVAVSTFRYWCNKFKACRADTDEAACLNDSDDKWYEISCRRETEVTCRLPAQSVDTIRLRLGDLKMEFPSGTDPGIILQIAKGLVES